MKARFVIDWDGTLVEDAWPEQGPWLPGAVKAIRALERLGSVVIYSCRVADFKFPSAGLPEDDVLRPFVEVQKELAGIQDMLNAEGLGHIEIWQRNYKPPATAYIDNRGVNFDGDWDATMERILDLLAPITVKEVEKKKLLNSDPGDDAWRPKDLFDDTEPEEAPGLTEPCTSDCEDCSEAGRCLWDDNEGLPLVGRHPSSARFHEILKDLGELHDQKSIGYGTNDDPLANVRASADWGIPAWQGSMLRAGDKIKRLQAYAQKGELPFEAIEDAFKDLAVYSIIGLVLFEQEQACLPSG